MFEDPTFQNEENARKAALKQNGRRKKEYLKTKYLANSPEDDLKQALKAEREIRKKARQEKKQKAFKKRLS